MIGIRSNLDHPVDQSQIIRPVMGRIGEPKCRFVDFVGEINGFQNNEEIVFEFSGGLMDE